METVLVTSPIVFGSIALEMTDEVVKGPPDAGFPIPNVSYRRKPGDPCVTATYPSDFWYAKLIEVPLPVHRAPFTVR
jgi:hypothetical protein